MMELDVILIGRIAIDFNPEDYYKPLCKSERFRKYLGGSPANIAVGLARLGLKVGFLANISDDAHGEFVLNRFIEEGVNIEGIVKDKEHRKIGLTFTEMKSPTESSILMYRDEVADLFQSPEDIREEYLGRAKILVISGVALSRSPSRDAVLKAMLLAKKNGMKIIFDLDYRPYTWKCEEEISIYYSLVAEYADIIIGSKEEYKLTSNIYGQEEVWMDRIRYLLNRGCELAIVKIGKEGSLAYTPTETLKVEPFQVKMLKSFGGGDAYASAFIYGYLNNLSLKKSLELASAHAAMLVSSHACSEDMKTLKEIETFIEERRKIDDYKET